MQEWNKKWNENIANEITESDNRLKYLFMERDLCDLLTNMVFLDSCKSSNNPEDTMYKLFFRYKDSKENETFTIYLDVYPVGNTKHVMLFNGKEIKRALSRTYHPKELDYIMDVFNQFEIYKLLEHSPYL